MLNDVNMLPSFILEMKEIEELLAVEGKELDRVEDASSEFLKQLIINEADFMISRYEKIFNLSGKGLSIDERRKNILSKRNMTYSATRESMLEESKRMTGLPVEIAEIFKEYTFTVDLIQNNLSTEYVAAIRNYLDTVKPAHLIYILTLIRYEETQITASISCVYSSILCLKEVI